MSTYAENAAARERHERKRAQDLHQEALHRSFDASAKDNHMKYERPQFAVVTASDAFREGYDKIQWHPTNRTIPTGKPCEREPAS